MMGQMKARSQVTGGSSHSHHPPSRHSQSNSQSFRTNPMKGSTTPMASPRMPHSVGQQYPPTISKLSPGIAADVRTPSPNYFGLNVEPVVDPRDTNTIPRENWSPPSSSVKSFAAALPKQMPLDANPEFEAFRRQADANSGKTFSLGSSHFAPALPPLSAARPKPPRWPTNQSESSRHPDGVSTRMDIDSDSLHDSAYVSSDSKRNSEISLNPPTMFDAPRHESPAQSDSPFQPLRRSNLSQVQDAHPRLSLPQNKLDRPTADLTKPRSETLPSTLDSGPGLIMPNQLKEILANVPTKDFLLLDVRVSSHYAQSRIQGALNLCIPTTLLKRATFDIQKLMKTLQTEEDQQQLSQWRTAKYLVIYDSASSDKRDAHSSMSMFKKFTNEGFTGKSYLLRGGFHAFATSYAELVDRRHASERAGKPASTEGGRPMFAPVIGGVSLPTTANSANPFFSNIRQNMDLADGVGQMDIALPANLEPGSLPSWLRVASAAADHGKLVSDMFLKIERSEQARMRNAYSTVTLSGSKPPVNKVELCGIEKGGKNRYKDILPFEHARVHLADREDGTCDYINASHINPLRSNKRYIASQGPLPATYDDFWSVIWDQDVRVIVMLTAESEGGQLKCHPYWQSREFGSIRLKPLSEKKVSLDIDKHRSSSTATPSSHSSSEAGRRRANTTTIVGSSTPTAQSSQAPAETPFVIIRKFALSHATNPFAPIREITQLHYPSWPDFGAPAQPSHLLALVELANVMQRSALPVDANSIAATFASDFPGTMGWTDEPEHDSAARPMLVHCSAGCGRTGTFCTVDTVIDMLKRQKLASVAARKRRDVDNDVDMDESVSPFTTTRDPLASSSTSTPGNGRTIKPAFARSTTGPDVDLSWLSDDKMDLIERTVEDFRGQRLSMVQSLRQFVLCYESILEWVWRLQERSNGAVSGRGRARSGSLEPALGR